MQWGRVLNSKLYFARRAVAVEGEHWEKPNPSEVNVEVAHGYLLLQKQSVRVMTKDRSYVIYCNLEGH